MNTMNLTIKFRRDKRNDKNFSLIFKYIIHIFVLYVIIFFNFLIYFIYLYFLLLLL